MEQKPDPQQQPPQNNWTKSLIVWVAIIFGMVLFVQALSGTRGPDAGEQIPYSEFISEVEEGKIRSVNVAESSSASTRISGERDGTNFVTIAPANTDYAQTFRENNVAFQVREEKQASFWQILLYQSLPFILILGIAFFVIRQMQKNAGGGAMGFGKSKAKMLNEAKGKVTFEDVAGIDEAREELQEIVEFLKDPGKFARLGGKIEKAFPALLFDLLTQLRIRLQLADEPLAVFYGHMPPFQV